jgi:hypothetical protein
MPLHLLAALSLSIAVQTARGAEKSIMLRLLACEAAVEPAKVFLKTGDSKSDVFDLPSSAFSGPVEVSARSLELKAVDNDAPLCGITLPAEGKAFAILLAPDKTAGMVPFIVRLDDDTFKAGDYFFVNHTEKTVALKLGANEVVIEAGKTVTSRPTEPVHNHHYIVTMSTRDGSADKTFASTRWPLNQAKRAFVIFSTRPNGRVTYRAVDE